MTFGHIEERLLLLNQRIHPCIFESGNIDPAAPIRFTGQPHPFGILEQPCPPRRPGHVITERIHVLGPCGPVLALNFQTNTDIPQIFAVNGQEFLAARVTRKKGKYERLPILLQNARIGVGMPTRLGQQGPCPLFIKAEDRIGAGSRGIIEIFVI